MWLPVLDDQFKVCFIIFFKIFLRCTTNPLSLRTQCQTCCETSAARTLTSGLINALCENGRAEFSAVRFLWALVWRKHKKFWLEKVYFISPSGSTQTSQRTSPDSRFAGNWCSFWRLLTQGFIHLLHQYNKYQITIGYNIKIKMG